MTNKDTKFKFKDIMVDNFKFFKGKGYGFSILLIANLFPDRKYHIVEEFTFFQNISEPKFLLDYTNRLGTPYFITDMGNYIEISKEEYIESRNAVIRMYDQTVELSISIFKNALNHFDINSSFKRCYSNLNIEIISKHKEIVSYEIDLDSKYYPNRTFRFRKKLKPYFNEELYFDKVMQKYIEKIDRSELEEYFNQFKSALEKPLKVVELSK